MTIFTPLSIVILVVSIAILIVIVAALIDAARHPAGAYISAGKLSKPAWLGILGAGLVLSLFGIFALAGLIAAIVYFVDVRPRLREFRPGSTMGPYGPW